MSKNGHKPPSLRGTLLTTFFLSALICFAVGLYNFLSINVLLQDMAAFVDDTSRLSAVQTDITALQDDIDEYLFTRSTDSLRSYWGHYDAVERAARQMVDGAVYDELGIQQKNLGNLLLRYLDDSTAITRAKTNEEYSRYVALYSQVSGEYNTITESIRDIMAQTLQANAQQYESMQSIIRVRTGVSYALFAASIALVVVLLYSLSNQVTRPIGKLAGYARQVADGDYSLAVDEQPGSEELNHLYDAFAIMVENTRRYLEGLAEKQELESELSRERIKSLETDNLLQQSELQALHAQMNPHFIFNTINIGAQLALLEGGGRTRTYLENAAQVFRYNLDGLGNTTLAAELAHVDAYMGLLTIRFGEKLRYREELDDGIDTGRYTLPRMTLQPLVENAFVHGVSPCEEGGEISVTVRADGPNALVSIANTGKPFPKETIDGLYSAPDTRDPGHVSGIGLSNVIKRLQLALGIPHPIAITAGEHSSTVTLTIPPHKVKEDA